MQFLSTDPYSLNSLFLQKFEVPTQLGYMKALLTSLPWWKLEPNENVILWGPGAPTSKDSTQRPAVRCTPNFNWIIAYLPSINFTNYKVYNATLRIPDSMVCSASWFDPRTSSMGPTHHISSITAPTWSIPTQPTSEDWVLVIKCNPGQSTNFVQQVKLLGNSTRRGPQYGVGMRIDAVADGTVVTRLGRFKVAGNKLPRTLSLLRYNGESGESSLLANAVVNMSAASDSLGFVYSDELAAPVSLVPGVSYLLVSNEVAGEDFIDNTLVQLVTSSIAVVRSAVYFEGSSWHTTGDSNSCYGPLSFVFE